MHHLSNITLTSLLLLFLANAVEAYGDQHPAPKDRLVSMLTEVESLHAGFTHHTRAENDQTGEIWLQKPGLFRLETGAPLSQTIVSDGTSLWIYDRDLEQVVISPLETSVDEMPILLFSGDPDLIPVNYHIEFFEDEHRQHFLLTPIDSTNLVTTLVLSFIDGLPVTISVENAMHERTTIELTNVAEVLEENEGLFTLQIPDVADVIDDRPG